ncbi:MAG: tRNA (adenosine(37)-N6)-threonylcarbamoyltransferase complex dimerization subunit type 1 TsaB [Candidatus Aquicultorales bacterium]
MRILALDTSSPACSVAVAESGDAGSSLLAEINVWAPRGHMARMLPQIDAALAQAGMEKEAIEGIAVGIGPGSFTGLRIGVTIARTLAQLLEVPIAGIPSPDALVRRVGAHAGVCVPTIDAKRGEVYAAVYETGLGGVERITDFRPITPEALAYELIDAGFERILFTGDGIEMSRGMLAERLGDKAVFTPREYWWPWASEIAYAAADRFEAGSADDLFSLVPVYARLSQAEEMWIKKKEQAR